MHLNFATKMTAPYTHEKRSREALHGSPRRLQFYSCCEKFNQTQPKLPKSRIQQIEKYLEKVF